MKKRICLLFVAASLITSPALADETPAPIIVSKSDGDFDIGVERTGALTTLVSIKKTATDSSTTNKTTEKIEDNLFVMEKSKTTATNPNKDATKPKPSGLLSGVARAFGGDYSGLASWGMGFVDHMAEPRFKTAVSNTTSTKELKQTKATDTIKTSVEKKEEFLAEVTKSYSQDINKGYIRFGVILANAGKAGVTIDDPYFSVYFLRNGNSEYVGKGKAGDLQGRFIPAGGSLRTSVTVRGLDFEKLFQRYAAADGILIETQEIQIQAPDSATYISIDKFSEEMRRKNVSVDYFDGDNRAAKFVSIDKGGETVETFLRRILEDKDWEWNATPGDLQEHIRKIGLKSADMRKFSDLQTLPEKFAWRRWFVSVLDRDGEVINAKLTTVLKPGFSLRIGYFGAEDVLPESVYRPVVCEKAFGKVKYNSVLDIPCNLQLGDILSFEDIKLTRFTQDYVKFSTTKLATPAGIANSFMKSYSAHNTAYFAAAEPPFTTAPPSKNYYRLTPTAIEEKAVEVDRALLLPAAAKMAPYGPVLPKKIGEIILLDMMWTTFRNTRLIDAADATASPMVTRGAVTLPSPSLVKLHFADLNDASKNNVFERKFEHVVTRSEELGPSSRWAFFKHLPCLPAGLILTNDVLPGMVTGRLLSEYLEIRTENRIEFTGNFMDLPSYGYMSKAGTHYFKYYEMLMLEPVSAGTKLLPIRPFADQEAECGALFPNAAGPEFSTVVRVIRRKPAL
jgi:hypothetical protein